MPELPEVETIVRSLRNSADLIYTKENSMATRPGIIGRVVNSVKVHWPRSLVTPSLTELEEVLPGQTVQSVDRRGKYILVGFSAGNMLIHLRMSGDIRVEHTDLEHPEKHDRMEIHFTDGWQMVFNDPRKFGRVWFVPEINEVTGSLGEDPFSELLTAEILHRKLQSTARRIKPLLLDQTIIAGLGNIYTDEALFLAGINPLTHARDISELQTESLLRSIRLVLEEGIRRNGASIDWVYRGGDFQNYFKVYQRTGEPCLICGTKIERTVVGQRGTHFCPNCQPYNEISDKSD